MAGRGWRGRDGSRGHVDYGYGWGVPVRGMYDYSLDYGNLGGPETDSESIPGYETEPPDWAGPTTRYESHHWAASEPTFERRHFDDEPDGLLGGDRLRPRARRWARPESGRRRKEADWPGAGGRSWRGERGMRAWSPYRTGERSRGYDALYDDDAAYRAPYGFEGVFADRPGYGRDQPSRAGRDAAGRPGYGREYRPRAGRGPSGGPGPTRRVPGEWVYDRVFRSTGPGPQWPDYRDRLDREAQAGRRAPRGERDQRPWPYGPWRAGRSMGGAWSVPQNRPFRGGVAPIDD